MSQVDDWSDGYTSDYLRDLNTYGPASANVPRPGVVSHQVQYQPPVAQTEAKTNDTPLYDNDGGFNPGPQRLVSAPARPFRGNATAAQRAARPKPAVKKKTQLASKQRTQPEYRTGGARTPEENEITRSAAEHRTGADLGQLGSQALDAAARFRPALKLLGFGAGAGSADTASTDTQQDDLDRAYNWTATGNAGTGGFSPERPMIDSSDAASGIPPEIMARLKKDADDGSPWGLLPWALGPIYKPVAGLLPAGQKLLPAGQKLLPAGQELLPAGQKLLPAGQKLLPYNGEAAAGAVGSKAGEAAAGDAAAGAGSKSSFRFDLSPEEIASAKASHDAYVRGVDSELIQHIRSGTLDEMERAWIEATAAGAAKAPGTIDASTQAILNEARAAGILGRDAAGTAGTGAGSAAGTGSRGSFGFDLSPEEIASAKASHDAYVRGTAGAADGGVSKLAEAGNVGRETAAGEQAASREAIVAARNAAVAKLDPQLQAALANVRKSLANHNISPRQVLHELESPTASDKDFYEIGRIFFEVGRRTHGAGLSPAEQAVADAYIKSFSERMSQGWSGVGRGLTQAADRNFARGMIDDIKNGTVDPNSLAYIRGLATRNAELTPDAQALLDAARAAGLIP